jgi:hypothetical protein
MTRQALLAATDGCEQQKRAANKSLPFFYDSLYSSFRSTSYALRSTLYNSAVQLIPHADFSGKANAG